MPVPALVAVATVIVFAAATFGDAAIGALIAGVFSLVNTLLLLRLRSDQHEVKKAVTADDRRKSWRTQRGGRRRDDPPT
jgi:hypothetical protein